MLPIVLRIAPVDDVPVPAIDIASASVIVPLTRSSLVPEIVVDPPEVPSDPELDATTIPAEIVVGPV